MKIFTTMKIEDVENLKQAFAKLTEEGWVIPLWLVNLEKVVKGESLEGSARN